MLTGVMTGYQRSVVHVLWRSESDAYEQDRTSEMTHSTNSQ